MANNNSKLLSLINIEFYLVILPCPVLAFSFLTESNAIMNHETLFTPAGLVDRHAFLKLSTLRKQLAHRRTNGLNKAITMLGTSILIDEALYIEWLKEQGATK